MRRLEAGWISVALGAIATVGLFYLLLPIVMIFPLSIDPGATLRFPPQGFSLVWYERYLADPHWIDATFLSLRIAAAASLIATVVGTFASIGLYAQRLPAHSTIVVILLLPMMLPLVVVAIAIYGMYASLQLVGTEFGIAVAHAVLAIPFVFLNVNAALAALPKSYFEASQSLGAGPLRSVAFVVIPLIWRGIAAGAVFAFVLSFDEVVVAMFLSGVQSTTLPKRMLDGIFFDLKPILASISAALVIFNVALAALGFALLGASKRTAKSL